jgi:hypothetical protein
MFASSRCADYGTGRMVLRSTEPRESNYWHLPAEKARAIAVRLTAVRTTGEAIWLMQIFAGKF